MKQFVIVKRYLQGCRFYNTSYNNTIIQPLAIISFLLILFISEFSFKEATASIIEQYETDSIKKEKANDAIPLLNGNSECSILLINEQYTPRILNYFIVTKQQTGALLLKAEISDVVKKLEIIIPGLNVSAIIFPFHYFL